MGTPALRTTRWHFALTAAVMAAASGPLSAHAATFTVTTTADAPDATPGDGMCATAGAVCTLRAAIQEANADSTKDTIAFNIPGAGVHVIKPTSQLPALTEPAILDAYTQPGAKANTKRFPELTDAVIKIEIDGSLAGDAGANAAAFTLAGGDSAVRGFSIYKFIGSNGGRIIIASDNNQVDGNYIGLDATGLDVPEGLVFNGITDWAGNGIVVRTGTGNIIGGTTDSSRNVIINAWRSSVQFRPGTGGTVSGNFIGVDKTGLSVPDTDDNVPPYTTGIQLEEAEAVVIGGDTWSKKNVICARSVNNEAVRIYATDNTLVRSNYLNWYADGNTPCGANSDGVFVGGVSNNVVITENSISSQSNKVGIKLSQAYDATITDNSVGVSFDGDAVSTASGPNTAGISLSRADNCLIQGNTIATLYNGILFVGEASTGTRIVGNFIGTDSSGTKQFSNNVSIGIQVLDVSGATIGGPGDGEGNLIRGGNTGVYLSSVADEIAVVGNRIWEQVGPQIDLFPTGINPNDEGDFDGGANSRQNFPEIETAKLLGDGLRITGKLNSTADTTFRVELFASAEESNVTTGPAERLLGAVVVTTDAAGDAPFEVDLGGDVAVGEWVTGTATRCEDETCEAFVETSEVSLRVQVEGCKRDSECSEDAPVCKFSTGLCVQCEKRADCAEGLVCDTTSNMCVGCEADAECSIGDICNEDGRCADPKAASSGGGCGCAMEGAERTTGLGDALWIALAFVWLGARRRRL